MKSDWYARALRVRGAKPASRKHAQLFSALAILNGGDERAVLDDRAVVLYDGLKIGKRMHYVLCEDVIEVVGDPRAVEFLSSRAAREAFDKVREVFGAAL